MLSCETLENVTEPEDLKFPYPFIHLGLTSAFAHRGDEGDAVLSHILRKREEKLGIDDTASLEYLSTSCYLSHLMLD